MAPLATPDDIIQAQIKEVNLAVEPTVYQTAIYVTYGKLEVEYDEAPLAFNNSFISII